MIKLTGPLSLEERSILIKHKLCKQTTVKIPQCVKIHMQVFLHVCVYVQVFSGQTGNLFALSMMFFTSTGSQIYLNISILYMSELIETFSEYQPVLQCIILIQIMLLVLYVTYVHMYVFYSSPLLPVTGSPALWRRMSTISVSPCSMT